MLNPFFYNLAEICSRLALKEVILSPGSRCAPLTIAFNRHPAINIRTISDERSAGYIGMGIAIQSKAPVGLVCTSGTAAANYLPSVAEAFYQQVPMIVFTADRPPEWIDQQDGQAIRQLNIYGTHVKGSFQLPMDLEHTDTRWHFIRTLAEAIELSKEFPAGPVHINVPFREPFYPSNEQKIEFDKNLRIRNKQKPASSLSPDQELVNKINAFSKILIVGGQKPYSKELTNILSSLSEQNIPVIGDIISNLHNVKDIISHPDNFLSHIKFPEQLIPDLLITFGNSVISKSLKLFFRRYPPKEHWHIQQAGQVADPFQSITKIINIDPVSFLSAVNAGKKSPDYKDQWMQLEHSSINSTMDFLHEQEEGEFQLVNKLITSLPSNINLHLANSMSVRYANFIGVAGKQNVEVYSNRGTSGIDGCNSTAVGIALADPEKQNFLITGDMAFLYDRNAFWHNYPIQNLKILVLNNYGGGIFRMIDGPVNLPELEALFETVQRLTAKTPAKEYGIKYFDGNIEKNLQEFIIYPEAAVCEYTSEGKKNQDIFNAFKTRVKQSITK